MPLGEKIGPSWHGTGSKDEIWALNIGYYYSTQLIKYSAMQKIIRQLPYIYFLILIAILVFQPLATMKGRLVLLLFAIPFVVQMIRPYNWIRIGLAILCSIYALWMGLAWLSDFNKPAMEVSDNYWSFVIIGLLYVGMNVLMAFLLWRAVLRSLVEDQIEPTI